MDDSGLGQSCQFSIYSLVPSVPVTIGYVKFTYPGSSVTVTNLGVIGSRSGGYGISILSGQNAIVDVNNQGLVSYGVNVSDPSVTINNLINTGTIRSGLVAGVNNAGVIGTFTNAQGGDSSTQSQTALTYSGAMPTHYNVIVLSPTHYGQLAVTSPSGSTVFGVYSGGISGVPASILAAGTYSSVLTGLSSSNIVSSSLSGTYTGGYTWQLQNQSGSSTTWDLVVMVSGGGGGSGSGGSNNSAPSATTTLPVISNLVTGIIASIGDLGNAYNPILAGGKLVLTNGDSLNIPLAITNAGGVIQHPTSGSATLAASLTGSGGLTFTGAGTTVLTGTNTYTGGTTVSGGTLSVVGSSPTGSGDIVVASPATLMGTGTIAGNVTVSGVFKPGNSPGYLSTAQNVTFNSGGTYQQDIAGTTQANSASPVGATGYYSFLNVGGQLVINSGAILAPRLQNLFQTTESGYGSAPYVPNLGDTFRIATAAGGISGTFSSITQPAGLATGTQFIPFYNYGGSNSLDLAVIPTSYASTLASTSSNTQSVAAVLDKLSAAQMAGTATSTQTSLMYSTATQVTSSLASFAQSLAGEIYADTLAVISQTSQRVQNSVLARISDTIMPVSSGNPNTGMPMSTSGVTPQNPTGIPSASFSTNPAVNPAKDVIAPANNSVWGEIAYQYGNRSSDSNASGFNSNLYQAVFGADLYQENNIKAGAGFSLSTTNVSMNTGTGIVGQGSIFVYGKMPVMQDFVLDGMASVGLSSTDVTRNDPTSTNSLKAKGIKGNDVLLSAGISRPFDADDVTITPYVRATWQMVNQSPFDEGSASAAALSVNGYTGNGVRGVIGLAVGSKNKDPMVDPYTYKVNIAVGADTNTLINPTLTANLASYGTTIQAANVGNTFVQAGLYGTVKLSDNAFAYAGVTGEARSGQTLGGVNLGVRVQF